MGLFQKLLHAGEGRKLKLLESIVPEVGALEPEMERRSDEEILGGAALNCGWVAEMKTGEGKTLVATLPLYLNALAGYGAHLVTVNDYLARRDAEWMGRIYSFLGLDVGVVIPQIDDFESKRAAYAADITYGTNN